MNDLINNQKEVFMNQQKFFIGIAAVAFLIIGVLLGSRLSSTLGTIDMEALIIGLVLTNTIILLIINSEVLDIRELAQSKATIKKGVKK